MTLIESHTEERDVCVSYRLSVLQYDREGTDREMSVCLIVCQCYTMTERGQIELIEVRGLWSVLRIVW